MLHSDEISKNWKKLSLVEQMANVGSEISRTITWKNKNKENSKLAFYRALELIDLTVQDSKNLGGIKEILRDREMLVDWFLQTNEYKSTDEDWEKYFLEFNIAARINK